MTDHLEILITHGRRHQSRIHPSEMNRSFLEGRDTDAASSSMENHAMRNGSPGKAPSFPSSPPESTDHYDDRSLDDIFSETVSIENSGFLDRFNARKQELLMKLEEQRHLGERNEEGRSTAGLELQLLKDGQLEQLETIQVAIKEQLLRENAIKFSEMLNDLDEAHKKEVQELCKKHEEQVQLLRDQIDEMESQTRLEQLKRLHGFQLERKDTEQDRGRLTDMWITEPTDFDRDEELILLRADHSKKIDELTSKFRNEVATLSVKLEATKKECEQRVKQTQMLEKLFSQEKVEKLELLKKTELQNQQITELMERLDGMEISEERSSEEKMKEAEEEDVRGKMDEQSQQIAVLIQKLEEQQREEKERLAELRQQLEGEMDSLRRNRDEALALSREEVETWKVKAEQVEHQLQELTRKMDEENGSLELSKKDLMLSSEEAENWKVGAEQLEQRMQKLVEQLEEEEELLASWKSKVELSENQVQELRQQLVEKESLLQSNDKELALAKKDADNWKKRAEDVEELTLELRQQLEEGESLWKSRDQELMLARAESENWRRKVDEVEENVLELRQRLEEKGSLRHNNDPEPEEETDLLQKNNDQKIVSTPEEAESWKGKAELAEEKLLKLQQQLEEKESLLRKNEQELASSKEETESWKRKGEEMEVWKAMAEEAEQQHLIEMENWKKSFEQKSRELEELRESFELSRVELEESRRLRDASDRTQLTEKDYVEEYEQYLEHVEDRDGEISVLQDELREREAEVMQLRQLVKRHGIREEKIANEDLQLFFDTEDEDDDKDDDEGEPNEDEVESDRRVEGRNMKGASDDLGKTLTRLPAPSEDARTTEDSMINVVSTELLRHFRPKALFERAEDETELEALRREITTFLKEWQDSRKTNSVEDAFRVPDVEKEELQEALNEGKKEMAILQAEVESLRAVISEGLEAKSRLAEMEEELEGLKAGMEDRINEELVKQQSDMQLQKLVELEEMKTQLEEIDKRKESEMRNEYEESVRNLKDQCEQETTAKNEQIKRLSGELFKKMEEVNRLKELEHSSLRDPAPTLPNGQDGVLVSMLQADLSRMNVERNSMQQTNNQLMVILSDMVRVSLETERRITHCLSSADSHPLGPVAPLPPFGGARDNGADGRHGGGATSAAAEAPYNPRDGLRRGGHNILDEEVTNLHDMSMASDEGLDVSQRFMETLFAGPELDADSEEVITDSSNRLQRAVDRLLDQIEETGRQLREAQRTRTELLASVQERLRTTEELTVKCSELDNLLSQETRSREFLALELYKAEGLVQGYAAEKQAADECIRSLEETKETLARDLERTRLKLKEKVERESDVGQREQDLAHQRHALELSVGENDKGLLQENTQLTEEVRRLKQKLEDETHVHENRLREAESTNEELGAVIDRITDERTVAEEDYQHKIEALEKQMKYDKQFHEEQTIEREQERDDYQSKIDKLELLLRNKGRQESAHNHLNDEIQELEDQLKAKTESNAELRRKTEALERELSSNEITIHELRDFTRSLESELDDRLKKEHVLEERIVDLEAELDRLHDLSQSSEAAGQRESELDESLRQMKKTIHDLEGEIDKLMRSEQTLLLRSKQLEDEIRNLKSLQEELMQDKEALQTQVCAQLKLVSSLRAQVEDLSLGHDQQATSEVVALRQKLEEEKEASSRREKELSDLSDQLDQFRDQMMELHTNLDHAQAELEVSQTEKRNLEAEKDSKMKQHQLEKERMKTEMKVLRNDASLAQSMPLLSQTLLNEKNEEIDQMTRELNELREYVLTIETNVLSRSTQVDLEQLMSDVNIIQSMPLLARALLKEKDKLIDRIKRDLLEQQCQDRERINLLIISQDEQAAIEVQRNDTASLTESRLLVTESLLNEKEETINELTKEVSELRGQVSRLERTDASSTTQEEQERSTSKETVETFDEGSQTLPAEEGGGISGSEELSTSMPEVERHQRDDTRERHLFDTTDFGALLTKSRNSTDLSLGEVCSLEEDSGTSLTKMNERLAESSEQLNDILQEKENMIEDLTTRAQSLQNENDNLTDYSVNLEADFDRVQKMVEEKQKEVEALNQELYVSQTKVKTQVENYDVIQLVVQEKQNEIDGLTEKLQDLSTMVADKQKEIELLTEELYTTQSHAQTKLQKELRERQNVIDEKEEEMEELMQQLEKKDEIERELMRVKQLLENERKTVEQKSKDVATLGEQIDAMTQLKSAEEKATSLRVKELEVSRDELSDRLSHSEQLVSSLTKALDEERLKVQVEQNQQVLQNKVTKERHVVELAEQRSQLEMELSEQLAEVRRVLKEEHAHEIGSLMARYEEDLELLRRQEPVDDEEEDRSLHEAVDNNEQIDASIINDSLEQLSGNLESILKKLHSESVRVLSLSDIQFLRGLEQRHFDLARAEAAWKDEKASLLAAIQALKQLLLNTSQTTDVSQLPGGSEAVSMDWRSDILKAVHKVFAKDKEMLRADLQTYRVLHPNENQNFLELLEKTMKDQEARHRDGLDQLITIDRQSLVDEVHDLLQKNNALTREVKQEREKVTRNAQQFEDQCLQNDWEVKHQVETVEMKLKQEKLLNEDLQSRLRSEQTRAAEMAVQLTRERHASGDQQLEASELQTELTKARGALGREQAQVQSLSLSLAEEQRKVAQLNGNVVQGQVELQQAQQKLESERSMGADVNRRLTSVVERLEMDLDAERQRHRETKASLMDREATVSNLEREVESLREQIRIQESQFKVRLMELETSMNAAGTRNTEVMDLLEKERHSNSELRQSIDQEHESQRPVLLRFQNTIADLQANLDVERSKILELTSRLERDRCKAMVIEEEKGQVEETLTAEAAVSSQLRQNIKTLTSQKQEVQMELQTANQKLSVLQIEHSRLQSSLADSRTALETHGVTAKSEERQRLFRADQERQSDRRKILELESQVQVARQAATRLEQELSLSRKNEMNALEESRVARLRSHNSPRVTFNSSTKDGPPSTPPPMDKVDGALPTPISETLTIYQKQLETFQQRLQLLAIRLQEEMADASIRPSRENVAVDVRSEEQSLKKLLTELTSLNACITSDSLPLTGASIILSIIPALNDKILRHNSELTSYISRLTSEKQDLREIVSELQKAIAVLKDKEKRFNEVEDVEDQFASERVKWSRDASSMSLELSNARQETARLRADLRRAEIELEREREKYFSPAAAGELNFPADKEKPSLGSNSLCLIELLEVEIQRLYGKYLRADCARKSLIYQKKYLLLLLGGFQDCEEATLAAIARMGAFPSSSDGDIASTIRNRPLSRFRTAANVVIAISRLKFLVNKWRRATRIGTPVMGGFTQILPGSTYVPSSVNGFASTPLRSHSLSNVHRTGSLLPVPQAAASNSFESGDRPSYPPRGATHGWTASGGPRSMAQTTPPTKDRSKDQQPRHSSSGALSASNTNVFRSTLSMNTTPTRPTTTMTTPVTPSSRHDDETSTDSLNSYLQRVERIQQNLTAVSLSTPPSNITFRK